MNERSAESGPGFRLFQLTGLTLISLLLFSLISVLVVGGDLESVSSLKIAQLLQSIGIFFVPPWCWYLHGPVSQPAGFG